MKQYKCNVLTLDAFGEDANKTKQIRPKRNILRSEMKKILLYKGYGKVIVGLNHTTFTEVRKLYINNVQMIYFHVR